MGAYLGLGHDVDRVEAARLHLARQNRMLRNDVGSSQKIDKIDVDYVPVWSTCRGESASYAGGSCASCRTGTGPSSPTPGSASWKRRQKLAILFKMAQRRRMTKSAIESGRSNTEERD